MFSIQGLFLSMEQDIETLIVLTGLVVSGLMNSPACYMLEKPTGMKELLMDDDDRLL